MPSVLLTTWRGVAPHRAPHSHRAGRVAPPHALGSLALGDPGDAEKAGAASQKERRHDQVNPPVHSDRHLDQSAQRFGSNIRIYDCIDTSICQSSHVISRRELLKPDSGPSNWTGFKRFGTHPGHLSRSGPPAFWAAPRWRWLRWNSLPPSWTVSGSKVPRCSEELWCSSSCFLGAV